MPEEYTAWSPAEYLAQYYATAGVAEDEIGILQFVLNFLLEKKQTFSEMVEVGCGPTIHHAIPFAPYVDQLYLADYLESNLQEVRNWIRGTGHNWIPYVSGMLAVEGNNSQAAIVERTRMFRSKIAGLLPCNVLSAQPLGESRMFPLVTSFYCLECVQQEKAVWEQAMANVSSLVAPDGYLLLSALRNADKYLVCGKDFPATKINESDMWETLVACGFAPATINMEVRPSGWDKEGFDSIIVASAQKKRIS